jgi:hypothetical protein
MIIHPAKHLFQAKFPTLEEHEEEVFFQHPVHRIKCNQLGVLYWEGFEYTVYDKADTSIVRDMTTRKNCGSKLRVIWECYVGEQVTSPHFLYVNGNPLDTRFDNMIKTSTLTLKEKEAFLNVKRRFVNASVDHLIKLEARAERMGLSISELYSILMLPYWLISARKRFEEASAKVINPKTLERRGGSKSRTTEAEADEVERMYLQGQTQYAIIQRMGWNSTSRVKKVLRDRKLVR